MKTPDPLLSNQNTDKEHDMNLPRARQSVCSYLLHNIAHPPPPPPRNLSSQDTAKQWVIHFPIPHKSLGGRHCFQAHCVAREWRTGLLVSSQSGELGLEPSCLGAEHMRRAHALVHSTKLPLRPQNRRGHIGLRCRLNCKN